MVAASVDLLGDIDGHSAGEDGASPQCVLTRLDGSPADEIHWPSQEHGNFSFHARMLEQTPLGIGGEARQKVYIPRTGRLRKHRSEHRRQNSSRRASSTGSGCKIAIWLQDNPHSSARRALAKPGRGERWGSPKAGGRERRRATPRHSRRRRWRPGRRGRGSGRRTGRFGAVPIRGWRRW